MRRIDTADASIIESKASRMGRAPGNSRKSGIEGGGERSLPQAIDRG
jgi:hypothetical protein